MKKNSNSVSPLGIALLILLGAGCVFVYSRATRRAGHLDTLERIRNTGIVRIGYANEAPYGYLDSATGQITGEAPEIAKVILRRMGATRIEPVVTEFGSLIPGLKARRFDVIAAGMYITPERAQEIAFSNPTYAVGEAFLVRAGNPLGLHSFEDVVESPEARLGVMGGSVEHGYAKTLGVPTDRIVVFPDYPSALGGLRTGRVDAVAATVLTANDLLHKLNSRGIERARPFHDPVIDGKPVRGYGAFGFRKRDTALVREFNRQLADFIGTPEHLELVKPFGFSRETLPGNVTAAEIVEGT
jgi:polar amino acid transport system substrate-binding protein